MEWRPVSIDGGPAIKTSLTERETKELQRLAQDRKVLEVGSAYGYSTIVMAQVAEQVIAVDPHHALASWPIMNQNLKAYGVERKVVCVMSTSQQTLPTIPRQSLGMVFIDGDHQYDAVRFDLAWARMLVKPFGAVIAVHDYDEEICPDVRRALDDWMPPDFLVDTLAVYSDPRWP